jgi:hypothetical protein
MNQNLLIAKPTVETLRNENYWLSRKPSQKFNIELTIGSHISDTLT